MNSILEKYKKYLKDAATPVESDDFTREIIKEYYEEEDLKAKWKSILDKEDQLDSKKVKQISSRKNIFRIGSLIGIAASLLLLLYINEPSQIIEKSPLEQLLTEHYNHPVTRNVMKGDLDPPNTKSSAYGYYQNKEYQKSIPFFHKLIENESADEEDRFFLGLAYLYSKMPNDAILQFEWILEQANSERRDIATWHLALALIEAEEFDRAKVYLIEVTKWDNNKGQRKFAKKAQDLINAIDTQ